MARYRWVVFLDFDEWLVPKLQPAVGYTRGVGYTELLKQIKADPVSLLDASEHGATDLGQDGASWPVSFM